MRGKIFFIAIFFLGYIAFMPIKAEAACCEYEKGDSIECVTMPEGTAESLCQETAKLMTTAENPNARYHARKICEKPLEPGNRCICPKGKTCVELQVPFPGSETIEKAAYDQQFSDIIAKYIVAIFQFGVWVAISLAIFMIMVAGFMWLISAGNQGMITKAKGYITNALYGLIIALISYIMLQTINPRLVELQMPELESVALREGKDCCMSKKADGTVANMVRDIDLEGKSCQEYFAKLDLPGKWEVCHNSCCICENKYPGRPLDTGEQFCWWNPPSDEACAKKMKYMLDPNRRRDVLVAGDAWIPNPGGEYDSCITMQSEQDCFSKTSFSKACQERGSAWK